MKDEEFLGLMRQHSDQELFSKIVVGDFMLKSIAGEYSEKADARRQEIIHQVELIKGVLKERGYEGAVRTQVVDGQIVVTMATPEEEAQARAAMVDEDGFVFVTEEEEEEQAREMPPDQVVGLKTLRLNGNASM